jgi:hypothetical protein
MWKAFCEGFKQGYVGTNNTYQLEERYQAKCVERKAEYEMMKAETQVAMKEVKTTLKKIMKEINK